MRGTGDHTWVDLEVMTQEQFERFEEMENKTKSEITPLRNEDNNLQGPFTIKETEIMPAAKPISKDMCLTAMDKTKSVKAAARYLNCSYHHLKRYMKLYVDEESGKTLFDLHKNQQGKGIPKFLRASGKRTCFIRYNRR